MSIVSFIILICLSNLEIWDRFYPRFTLPSWDFFGGTLFDQAIFVFSEFSFQHVAPKKKEKKVHALGRRPRVRANLGFVGRMFDSYQVAEATVASDPSSAHRVSTSLCPDRD